MIQSYRTIVEKKRGNRAKFVPILLALLGNCTGLFGGNCADIIDHLYDCAMFFGALQENNSESVLFFRIE
jgi:hypothetical protein